jgi:lipopolysaccharide/colanic/teichoic acid biosynthesis glycosyltransferase
MQGIGLRPSNPLLYRIYNVLVGGILLLVALPTMGIIALALLYTQGRGVFYFGERLGKDLKPFRIIKFRTLCPEQARLLTQDRTLPADADIFTPLGKFLRDTRLDELPQLWNVIRGDMNICGPRPVRAEIRALYKDQISCYDDRFSVRPGLLGPTQAYFGHGTSKRLRAKMNSAAVRRPVNILTEVVFILRVIIAMVVKLATSLLPRKIAHHFGLDGNFDIILESVADHEGIMVDSVSSDTLRVRGAIPTVHHTLISIRMKSGAIRTARVRLEATDQPGTYEFTPLGEYSAYVVERYALGRAVLPPPVSSRPTEQTRPRALDVVAGSET